MRFTLAPPGADAVTRVVEFGVPVSVFNLGSVGSAATLDAALAALQPLRPDPARVQVEQLAPVGNSFYHGLVVEARRRFSLSEKGAGGSLRAAYTLSRLIDDGVVNTSSALRAGDFRGERARSLLDRRQRFTLAATLDAPRRLGRLRLAAVLRVASGAPFNVTLGGDDRNLDDVGNDRPTFNGDPRLIRWRRPGEPLDPRVVLRLRPERRARVPPLRARAPAPLGRVRQRPQQDHLHLRRGVHQLRRAPPRGDRRAAPRLRRRLPHADAHAPPAHRARRPASGFLKGGRRRVCVRAARTQESSRLGRACALG
ncbi:MAG: hypothetical protein LC795_15685 [Acidobacteria bacterium]|nr:hypothetical protein [Acidobacteriota bacterium]MCA1620717.1 hypothetical protein [Acidobacteriota bacterium]